MSALTAPVRKAVQERHVLPSEDQRLLLHDVSWESYVAMRQALAEQSSIRLTYDRGNLEIMTLSRRHEIYKKWLGRLFETLAEECGKNIAFGGQMTMQRQELARGIEGDDCYWIAHEKQMSGKLDWDPRSDPPPDLFVEVEVSRSLLDRLAICAALRIPEVWRYDGKTILVFLLQADGSYIQSMTSPTFPGIPIQGIAAFVQPQADVAYFTRIKQFRVWVRKHLPKKQPSKKKPKSKE